MQTNCLLSIQNKKADDHLQVMREGDQVPPYWHYNQQHGQDLEQNLNMQEHYFDNDTSADIKFRQNPSQIMNWKCSSCNKRFDSYIKYLDHCNVCQNLKSHVSLNKDLDFDVNSINKNEEGLFVCRFCPSAYMYRSLLKQHMMKHTGEKPYACPICPYRGAQKNHIDKHMLTHTGEKPYACHYCDYRCGRKETLKYHLKVRHAC